MKNNLFPFIVSRFSWAFSTSSTVNFHTIHYPYSRFFVHHKHHIFQHIRIWLIWSCNVFLRATRTSSTIPFYITHSCLSLQYHEILIVTVNKVHYIHLIILHISFQCRDNALNLPRVGRHWLFYHSLLYTMWLLLKNLHYVDLFSTLCLILVQIHLAFLGRPSISTIHCCNANYQNFKKLHYVDLNSTPYLIPVLR